MRPNAAPPHWGAPSHEGADATPRRQQGSLTVAIFIALLLVIGAFFIPSAAFDDWERHVLTAIVAGVAAGLLLRIRGFWRWLALLVAPSLILWTVVFVVVLVFFMILLPDGFIGD